MIKKIIYRVAAVDFSLSMASSLTFIKISRSMIKYIAMGQYTYYLDELYIVHTAINIRLHIYVVRVHLLGVNISQITLTLWMDYNICCK